MTAEALLLGRVDGVDVRDDEGLDVEELQQAAEADRVGVAYFDDRDVLLLQTRCATGDWL